MTYSYTAASIQAYPRWLSCHQSPGCAQMGMLGCCLTPKMSKLFWMPDHTWSSRAQIQSPALLPAYGCQLLHFRNDDTMQLDHSKLNGVPFSLHLSSFAQIFSNAALNHHLSLSFPKAVLLSAPYFPPVLHHSHAQLCRMLPQFPHSCNSCHWTASAHNHLP